MSDYQLLKKDSLKCVNYSLLALLLILEGIW